MPDYIEYLNFRSLSIAILAIAVDLAVVVVPAYLLFAAFPVRIGSMLEIAIGTACGVLIGGVVLFALWKAAEQDAEEEACTDYEW